jgi:hypothetical protein
MNVRETSEIRELSADETHSVHRQSAQLVRALVAGRNGRRRSKETKMRNAENTSDIRALTDAELQHVSGGSGFNGSWLKALAEALASLTDRRWRAVSVGGLVTLSGSRDDPDLEWHLELPGGTACQSMTLADNDKVASLRERASPSPVPP